MWIPGIVFLIVSQLNWKNILLLNAYEKGSICLLRMLNDAGRPVTVFSHNEIHFYPWPERLSLKPPMDGYLMIAKNQSDIIEVLRYLQKNHVLVPKHRWIIGIEEGLNLPEIMNFFNEGDRVLVITQNKSDSSTLCQEVDDVFNEVTQDEDIGMWTLRSPGDGSFSFHKVNFWNLSGMDSLFDSPFRDFRGRTLRISSLGSPPIRVRPKDMLKEKNPLWKGYIFQIINTLGEFLNFTYTVKEADNRQYGTAQEDGSWPGMIGELISKSVDIGAGDLSWTLERNSVVDLTNPIFPETVTFIYRTPEFYSRTWILFQGIDPKVSIAMMSATVAAFATYFLGLSLHRIWKSRVEDPAVVCIESADESISSLYRALLGKGVINVPFTASCRTVLAVWFVGSLILSALYGGSLTSKLSLHKSPKPADSLNELLKRHPNAILALRYNSQIHQFFKKSAYWSKVWLSNMEKYAIPGQVSIADTMTRVHNSSDGKSPYVWIADKSMLVKMMQRYSADPVVCDLYVAKEDIIKSDWSIALQRDSPFFEQFNAFISRMQRFGLLERWRREYWESAGGSCHPTDGLNQSGETPISLGDTCAIFIVLAHGWAVGIVLLIAERQYYIRSSG